jgi:hypothetical protein
MAEHGHLLGAPYPTGAIIGSVELVDIVRGHGSQWAIDGCWHWVLADPRPCDPVPARGALGLWDYS